MSPQNHALIWILVGMSGAALVATAHSVGGGTAEIARGRYLVEAVAGCGDCHTPRDAQGAPVKHRSLAGAPIGFTPVGPVPQWATYAPALAGLPSGFDEKQLSQFLQTGVRPNGSPARPPMPQFRLDPQDAKAVAAYVRSLSP